MDADLTRPLVLITGASSGIGQALATEFAKQGWRLALVARRVPVMTEWLAQQGLDRQRARCYEADVGHVESILAAAERCIEQQGLPDVVIANAGISVGMDTAILEDLQVMRDTFSTNNVGMAATFHPFISRMKARGSGRLVGVASVAAIRGMPGHGAYCASKSAVVAYCESLRGECRGSGVEVLTVLPGYVATPLTERNRYPMPFLISSTQFAQRAFRVIQSGRTYSVIPWQMGLVAKLLRVLPNALFDKVFAGRGRKRRKGE